MLTLIFSSFMALLVLLPQAAYPSSSTSVPPFIQVGAKPNVIVVLDNSNSMDEDFYGNAVGSYSPASKSVVAKKALIDVLDIYKEKLRVGLMTYKINSPSAYYLHNSAYFASYEPKSYCPNPPAECQAYCADDSNTTAMNACNTACQADNPLFDATYRDEIITAYSANSEQRTRYCSLIYPKTQHVTNPTDTSNFIFYKMALPYYDSSNQGTEFDYSVSYDPLEGSGHYSSYSRYGVKTGTSDLNSGYSTSKGSATFVPTDSDFALGFYDFGRRMYSYYASRTWFVNTSPNPAIGFRYVDVGELVVGGANTTTYSKLMTKLAPKENDEAGYMFCKTQSSTDSCHIVNTGLTPTSGTFKSIIDYMKGTSTPIQGNCEKTFVIYVTDGLPSVNESGATATADSLMPSVLSRIGELRNITVGAKTYDVQSYILGVGLSTPAKAKLDDMAQAGGTARAYDGSACTNAGGCAYYADNASQLQAALADIFSQVGQPVASAGAVATVSQEISSGDIVIRGAFRAYEETAPDVYVWYGHMESYWPFAGCGTLTDETKCTSVSGCQWNSGTSTCSGSNIYSFQILDNQGKFCPDISSNGNCWDAGKKLADTGSFGRDLFTYIETNTPKKTTFDASLSDSLLNNQLDINGDNVTNSTDTDLLIDWVFGDNATNARNRHGWILGDIIYSTPVVVGQPSLASVPRRIADAGCTSGCPDDACFYCYRQDNQHRDQTVYVGANDGMLHAFTLGKWSTSANKWIFNPADNATIGTQLGAESWAYIPSNLLSELQTLANPLYGESSATQHRYMVDLSPQAWDMKIDHDQDGNATTPEEWRTVLLGGERGGGDVYFALDVTDPGNPNVLGEFSVLKNYPASSSVVAGYTSHYQTLKKLTLAWSLPYAGRFLAPTHSNPSPYVAFSGGGAHDFRPDVVDANATLKLMDLDGWQYLYYPSFRAVDLETGNDLWRNAWTSLLASSAYQAYFPLNAPKILNPGFESGGGSLASWTDTVGTGGAIAVDTTSVHHGANAVKITAGTTPANTYLQQNITVVAGKQYQLTFWTRGDGGTYAGQYQIRNVTASSDIVAATSTAITATTYQKVSKIFTAPVGCTSVGIRLRCPSSNGRAAYFDDVSVVPYPYIVMPYAVSNVAAFDVYDSAGHSISAGSAPDGYTDLLYAGDYNGTLFSLPINASGEQSTLPSCVVTRKTKTITSANVNPYRGKRQPITVTPVAAIDESKGGGDLRVFFGTGKFDDVIIGDNSDKTDNATMTFYCMVEDLDTRIGCGGNTTTTIVPAVTGTAPAVKEKCSASSGSHHWVKREYDNVTSQNVTSADGDSCFACMLDFESPGERMLDSALVAAGYVFFTTFIPNDDSCSAGGTAYLYVLDYMCNAIESNPVTGAGTTKYLNAKTGTWSETKPDKVAAVRVSLGTGMPSRPVLDSTGESILIQTSDARLLKIDVDLGIRNKAKVKGWTYENN